jgi:hypothetical protein
MLDVIPSVGDPYRFASTFFVEAEPFAKSVLVQYFILKYLVPARFLVLTAIPGVGTTAALSFTTDLQLRAFGSGF